MPWRLILIVLLIAAAVYGASRLEQRSFVTHDPVSGEVRRNPMAAAGELMQARGRSVRHLIGSPGLFPLPGTDTLIVLDNHRAGLNTPRIEALYQWVARGGILMIEALPMASLESEHAASSQRWQRHDPLLYPLDITTHLPAADTFSDVDTEFLFADMFSNAASLFQRLCQAADGSPLGEECEAALCKRRSAWHDTEVYTDQGELRYADFNPRITLWHVDLYLLGDSTYDDDGQTHHDTAPRTYAKRAGKHSPGAKKHPPAPDQDHTSDYEKNAAIPYAPGDAKQYPATGYDDWDGRYVSDTDHGQQLQRLRNLLGSLDTRLTGYANSEFGAQLLQVEIGAGKVIVASDLGPWKNANLHYLDHAWLLDYLAKDSTAVWFVRGVDMERLPAWLWRHAAPFLLALVLLIALLVWRQLPRRGATLEDDTTRPGDFLAHLLASGRLLWRAGERTPLLTPLRDDVQARLARHPQARGLDEAGRIALAARLSNLPEAAVQAALTDTLNTTDTSDRLTTLVRTLQQLRRSL